MDNDEKLKFIKIYDPEGAERLTKLLEKKDILKAGNAYTEKFTERQFSRTFTGLLHNAFERALILQALSEEETIPVLSERLGMRGDTIFRHCRELMRRNLVEITGMRDRNPLFKRRTG